MSKGKGTTKYPSSMTKRKIARSEKKAAIRSALDEPSWVRPNQNTMAIRVPDVKNEAYVEASKDFGERGSKQVGEVVALQGLPKKKKNK